MRLTLVAAILPCFFALPSAMVAQDKPALLEVQSKEPQLVRSPQSAISTPFERFGASTVFNDGKLYSFGGMERGGAVPSNDLLEFDILGKAWSTVAVYGQKPPGRFFHSASVSQDGKTMYIMGGTPCFSRIYMKSLEFDDANGAYVTQRQHATTEALSIEHSQGLDDVYSFTFATKEWKLLKAATNLHALRCKAADNVYFRNGDSVLRPGATLLATFAAVLYAMF